MCTTLQRADETAVQLKWHNLRRRPDEPSGIRTNLEAGLESGAVMEVDIRLTRDGRWLCLHDETLDRETSGSGLASEWTAEELSTLRMRTPSGAVTDVSPLFLDELVAAASDAPDASAELQLDVKAPGDAITDDILDQFARAVGPVRDSFSLSGADTEALRRLRSAVPTLAVTVSRSKRLRGSETSAEFGRRLDGVFGELDGVTMVWLNHRVLGAAYDAGFDLVRFAHDRGFGVDTGTIDVDAEGSEAAIELALQAGVDRITTNSPCALSTAFNQQPAPSRWTVAAS